jgi:transcription initiation factor TFIIIB Brf1 subunit/transcription initiation factor TFIIB
MSGGSKKEREKLSMLDRSVKILLDEPDNTPSRKDGISLDEERLQRLQGTSLIQDSCQLLELPPPSVSATACVLFHRFFAAAAGSLKRHDVWSVAMASTLLAAKMEEVPLTVRQVVVTYAHLYRRRTLLVVEDETLLARILREHAAAVKTSPQATSLSYAEKKDFLKNQTVTLNPFGPLYQEWHDAVVSTENQLLRHLGFTVYWIPDNHVDKWVTSFAAILELPGVVTKRAMEYCDFSYRLDLCVRFDASVIACACIYLSAIDLGFGLPVIKEKSVWDILCGAGHDQAIADIANALAGLVDSNNIDVQTASAAFIKPLKLTGSFNDPDSFAWDRFCGGSE